MIPVARPLIDEQEKLAVQEVLDSGMLASGAKVQAFEKAFADFTGVAHGVATSSGTTALQTLFSSLDIIPGEKVLTTPFTFVATVNAILHAGLTPVLADIDPQTFNLDPGKAREALEGDPSIKAILLVHLYGLPCAMDAFLALKEEFDVYLLEDAAQAHGAMYREQKVGSFGDGAIFSFYPTKNMTTGEGGMLLTQDSELARKSRLYINHGAPRRYEHEEYGFNYRMTDLAAAMGLEQLKKLPAFNEKRRSHARFFNREWQECPGLILPQEPQYCHHVYHQYTVRVKDQESFMEHLQARGVGCAIHYPRPVHEQRVYAHEPFSRISLPQAEKASREVMSLPVHPGLTQGDLKEIQEAVLDYRGA